MKSKKIGLGSKDFTIDQVYRFANDLEEVSVEFPKVSRNQVESAHRFLQNEIKKKEPLYGINTGFGKFSNVSIPKKNLSQLQTNLIRSHAVGVGDALPEEVSRGLLLLRAHTMALGHSGVSTKLIDTLLLMIERKVHPVIPEQGSVGASGDLAPLAHLALVLIGEGKAVFEGKLLSGAEAMKRAKIKPIVLGPKEGLSLINGTQFMLALSIFSLVEAEKLARAFELSGALTLEAMRGTRDPFDPLVHELRPHPGQIEVAKRMRKILGEASEISESHKDCGKVQDPYSLRCIPQVHGPIIETLAFVRQILSRELHSVTDNPLVFPKEKKIVSGGNFHGENLAMAMDFLSIAVSELANISEQRIEKLMNPELSGLPPFLTRDGGLQSGLMIVQVAAASIVSENKTLSHPASVDSIPTSADKEDHVSMGAWAARKAWRVVKNTRKVLAMELFSASQGVELLRPLKTGPALEKVMKIIRSEVPPVVQDREYSIDINKIEKMIERRLFE